MVYFVATPIGNLKDITLRALETLESVDVIACEDTRNSLKLLNHYKIKKRLISYHKFNERSSCANIISLLKEGRSIAVISDSGMPLISDPGYVLVKRLKEENLPFTVIGGVSASLSALVLSGMHAERFLFLGFLPVERPEEFLKKFERVDATLIFFIASHSLKRDVKLIESILGRRRACFASEISKLFEKTFNFTLGQDLPLNLRGEFVLVVEGAKEEELLLNNLSVNEHITFYLNMGLDKNEALKYVASDRKVRKSEIYKAHEDSKKQS